MDPVGVLRDFSGGGPGGTAAARDAVPGPGTPAGHRFRRVLGHVPTGVVLITATTPDGPTGMAVNSFTSVSLDPPLVSFCAAHTSSTWPRIRAGGAFTVNVLGERDAEVCRRFARKGADRFAGLAHRPGHTGAPVLDGVAAHLDCELHAVHDAGDHVIVLGRVVHLDADEGVRPLVFHGGDYCSLRRPVVPSPRAGRP
jgi:3-hydroxy-9,10-secoandrosta-1,3,5(10)-triene-9,17-dione monooxygenase reductase component